MTDSENAREETVFGFRECSGVSYLFRPHPTAKRRIILWNSKVYASTCPENAATLSAISPNGVTDKKREKRRL